MARMAIFVTDTLPPEARSLLSDFEVFESTADDDALARCQALICWPSRAKAVVLRKMKSLKMVQTLSAGVDVLDFGSLPPGVQVFTNAGAFTQTVAEHAWGMLLGMSKGIHVRNQKTTPRSLRGKTLLVLGCGSIGSEVARLSKSLKMRTIGVSRSFRSPQMFEERHQMSSLPDLIGRADAIVVTLPLTNRTRGILGYDLLKKAKEAAILVNVGRGGTIEEEGLVRWLGERPESRFVTDVYWFKEGRESFSTMAWELPNFAGTLHVSGLPLGEDLSRAKVAAAKNVRSYLEGGVPLNHVDISEYLCEKRDAGPIALNTRLGGRAEQGQSRMPRKKSDTTESEGHKATERATAPAKENAQVQSAPVQRSAPYNHIFVGQKPVMNYAMSALIQLSQAGEVVVKARGMAISRAVDVAEIVTKRLGNGAFKVKDIGISTEVVGEGAEQRNISSIEIVVGK